MSGIPHIVLSDVSSGKRQATLLHEINWQINQGENWLVTGPTGSGKSILMHTLLRKCRIMSGSITHPIFDGSTSLFEKLNQDIKLVEFVDTSKLVRNPQSEHYYQQRFNSFDSEGHLTVQDYFGDSNLDLNLEMHQNLLKALQLTALLPMEMIKLSSGQTRKMLLAKALLSAPKVLILDHPHIGLDDGSRKVFNQLIDDLQAKIGFQLIMCGHFLSVPKCITHHLRLEKGCIVLRETIDHFRPTSRNLSRPGHQQSLQVLSSYFKDQSKSWESVDSIFTAKNLNIAYYEKVIFDGVNINIKQGTKWALLGPNGSGKSTIVSLIYADHPQAYSKNIQLFDRMRGTGESIWDIKDKIGFSSPELHAYFEYNFKGSELILTGFHDGFAKRKHSQEQIEIGDHFMNYFGLSDLRERAFGEMSTGEQRLLFFIRAMIKAPMLLLLDEPFQSLDDDLIAKSRYLLNEVLQDKQSMIFISHFKEEIPEGVTEVFELTM